MDERTNERMNERMDIRITIYPRNFVWGGITSLNDICEVMLAQILYYKEGFFWTRGNLGKSGQQVILDRRPLKI